MALSLILNGQPRTFDALSEPATLDQLVHALGLKSDRVAVEHNGTIAPRTTWCETALTEGDRLEVVHFVGGGTSSSVEERLQVTKSARGHQLRSCR